MGVGCGHEELMYFLANRVKIVDATDLYEGAYLGGESAADVLAHPDKYAPFRYRSDRLNILRMDAKKLDFEDGTFDFLFSLSSLEHFGKRMDQLTALKEMHRVLKPGGIAALTTELILNRLGHRRDYFRVEILEEIIRESGFFLVEPFLYKARIDVLRAPSRVNRRQKIPLALRVTNVGDAVWYRNFSSSHYVWIGAWLTDKDGRKRGGEPIQFLLPKDVMPGESVHVSLEIPAFGKPGPAEVHLDLVKELCFWFRHKGSPEKIVPLEID